MCDRSSLLILFNSKKQIARNKILCYNGLMSQDHIVKLRSTESKHVRFDVRNRKRVEKKLELNKYDPTVRKVVKYKEVKK